MAAEVTSPNFAEMQKDLEEQELQAPGGIASAQVYNQLLALYLLHNEMCQAKFLWKRIPPSVKSTTPELTLIWMVGQKMWQRDYTGTYDAMKKEFTEVKPIMDAALEACRRRAFQLVSQAYSSINADELAIFLGMPTAEAVQAAQAEGWGADTHTNVITPCKPEPVQSDPEFRSDQQLSILTDYVSFLES